MKLTTRRPIGSKHPPDRLVSPGTLTAVGDTLYFISETPMAQLWKLDDTGVQLVKT